MKLINLFNITGKPLNNGFTHYSTTGIDRQYLSPSNLYQELRKMPGSFAIVQETEETVTLICDFVRSIPIFYCVSENMIVIGNNGVTIAKYCHADFDDMAKKEFLYTSYVTGNKTLFQNIYTVLPGECVSISKLNGTIEKHFYWEMLYGKDITHKSEQELIQDFDDCLIDVFKDLVSRLDGRTALLPLSGGCDSRIVATMLKRLNYKNVICFSYGRRGNNDAVTSKKIAAALGFPWYFIEYTKDTWKNLYASKTYSDYLSYSCNGSGIGSIRSFPAMSALKAQVPADCIVIPGHTLDVTCGSHIPIWEEKQLVSKDVFLDQMLKRHYRFRRNPKQCQSAINQWAFNLPSKMDLQQCVQEIQYFEWINRQPKFIANEVRKYEFLEYSGWELPFWDYRVCDFVRKLPIPLLLNRQFEYKYMEKMIDPLVNIHADYFSILKSPNKSLIKKMAKICPLPSTIYHFLMWRKHDAMAFYDHMSLLEYTNWIVKCGKGFNVHAMTAEHGLHKIETIMSEF